MATKSAAASGLWPPNPRILEMNTLPWLRELSSLAGSPIKLDKITLQMLPSEIHYFDAEWLMGIWQRSETGRAIAINNPPLHQECCQILPDLKPEDLSGSAFSLGDYAIDPLIGDLTGLTAFRQLLHAQGVKLILDFIPNHVGPDYPAISAHPEWFLQGSTADMAESPEIFFENAGKIFAHGRDPHFTPWIDTVQVNAFNSGLKSHFVEQLSFIATICDGVRCDTSMLVLNRIFYDTWGRWAGPPPAREFWTSLILPIKEKFPNFLFIAEVYWDLESTLHGLGFDLCYDKSFYDTLWKGTSASIIKFLSASLNYQSKLVRFLENHDEPRSLGLFGLQKAFATAVILFTSPGAKLILEGQFEGHLLRVPVQLKRRQHEQPIREISNFYQRLLAFLDNQIQQKGKFRTCAVSPFASTAGTQRSSIISYYWEFPNVFICVIVNFSSSTEHATLTWLETFQPFLHKNAQMSDRLSVFHSIENSTTFSAGEPLGEVQFEPWETWILRLSR